MDLLNSRHPLAIKYNELGNRILDLEESIVWVQGRPFGTDDLMGTFMVGQAIIDEIERLKEEMRHIEYEVERDEEWEDHWLQTNWAWR